MNRIIMFSVRTMITTLSAGICFFVPQLRLSAQPQTAIPAAGPALPWPEIQFLGEEVNYLACDGGSHRIAAALSGGTAKLWNLPSYEPRTTGKSAITTAYIVALNDGSKLMAVGGFTGEVLLWPITVKGELQDRPIASSKKLDPLPVTALAFGHAATSDILAVGSKDNLILYQCHASPEESEPFTFQEVKRIKLDGTLRRLTFSPNGKWLAAALVRTVGTRTQHRICTISVGPSNSLSEPIYLPDDTHHNLISWLTFSADGRNLASCDDSGITIKWLVADEFVETSYQRPDNPTVAATSAVFARDDHLVVGYLDGKIALYKGDDAKPELLLNGHTGRVTALGILSDGDKSEKLISGSFDKTVRIWRVPVLWNPPGASAVAQPTQSPLLLPPAIQVMLNGKPVTAETTQQELDAASSFVVNTGKNRLRLELLPHLTSTAGSPLNAGDPPNQTGTAPTAASRNAALIGAAKSGDAVTLKALITDGADVNAKDKNDDTALIWAAFNGNTDCVKALVAAKADANAKSRVGDTALILAAQREHVACIRALIDGHAEVNAKNRNGDTALILAAQRGYAACIRALIEGQAEVNAVGSGDNTALMAAASEGYPDCLKLLIDAGANINAENAEGKTALGMATSDVAIAILKAHGAR